MTPEENLKAAIVLADVPRVRELLADGIDLKRSFAYGHDFLAYALNYQSNEHEQIAIELVENGADIHTRSRPRIMWLSPKPLIVQAWENSFDNLLLLLISKGVDTSDISPCLLSAAIKSKREQLAITILKSEFLLKACYKPLTGNELMERITELAYLAINELCVQVAQRFVETGFDYNQNPTKLAAALVGGVRGVLLRTGREEDVVRILSFLVSKGVDIKNCRNEFDVMPSYYAVRDGLLNTIRFFIELGFDYNNDPVRLVRALNDLMSWDREGDALVRALRRMHRDRKGSTKDVLSLLVSNGVNINCRGLRGTMPCFEAVRICSVDIVRFFVEHGFDINATNDKGETCLFHALGRGPAMISFLALCGIDLNHRNNENQTALSSAYSLLDRMRAQYEEEKQYVTREDLIQSLMYEYNGGKEIHSRDEYTLMMAENYARKHIEDSKVQTRERTPRLEDHISAIEKSIEALVALGACR